VAEHDAVLAICDAVALCAMATLRATGRKVLADVAVAGFDDVPAAAHSGPALTTATDPVERIRKRASGIALGDATAGGATVARPRGWSARARDSAWLTGRQAWAPPAVCRAAVPARRRQTPAVHLATGPVKELVLPGPVAQRHALVQCHLDGDELAHRVPGPAHRAVRGGHDSRLAPIGTRHEWRK